MEWGSRLEVWQMDRPRRAGGHPAPDAPNGAPDTVPAPAVVAAVIVDDAEAVKVLIEAGDDVHDRTRGGRNALSVAGKLGREACLREMHCGASTCS